MDSPNFTGGSSKFSRIAAPLTLILKTSSTESAELRKGVVGVGGGGRNRVEPVGKHESFGKHEFDDVDDGGGCSGDFDVTFQVTRWRSRHYSSKRTVAFDCVSGADHEKLIPVALD